MTVTNATDGGGGAPLISVVVCTYNRSRLLGIALESLCRQTLAADGYEVIVVDNNSTDQTRAVVERFEGRGNVRHVLETRVGLSHARNRGWQEARGAYVAYTDDDCDLPGEWLAVAKSVIEGVAPGVFGGPYRAFYDTPKPRWFKDAYGTNDLIPEARTLAGDEYLTGMNFFVRADLLRSAGGFDPRLGMAGDKVAYAEETAFIKQVRLTSPDEVIYYDPRLYVRHLVRPEKMTLRWASRMQLAQGRDHQRMLLKGGRRRRSRGRLLYTAGRVGAALSRDAARGLFWRDRTRHPYYQNFLFEHAFLHVQELGRLLGEFFPDHPAGREAWDASNGVVEGRPAR